MNAKKGFTLIEIMIVVAIIAILAAIAIPNFIAYRKTSQMNACIANLKQLDAASEAYRIKKGDSTLKPSQSDLVGTTAGEGFIKSTLKCPAGGSYTAPSQVTDHWTCADMGSDSEYPHKITD